MTNLWKAGTRKAFYGYIGQLAIGLVGAIIIRLLTPNAWEILKGASLKPAATAAIIAGIASIIAFIYHILGINDMKNAAANTNLATATQRLWIAAVLGVCGSVLTLIVPILGSLTSLAGFIVAWTGYAQIKDNATDEHARFAGSKLTTFALLTVIAGIATLLPGIGGTIAMIINFIALYFAITGWKALADSELP